MRRIGLVIASFLIAIAPASRADETGYNIVLFLIDDLGFGGARYNLFQLRRGPLPRVLIADPELGERLGGERARPRGGEPCSAGEARGERWRPLTYVYMCRPQSVLGGRGRVCQWRK